MNTRLFSFICEKTVLTVKTLELCFKKKWNIVTEKWNHFYIVQSNVHFNLKRRLF